MWEQLKIKVHRQHTRCDRQIQNAMEKYSQRGGKFFCGKGCHNCCTLTVNAVYSEALLMAEKLTDAQTSALYGYIARLRELLPRVTEFKSYLRMQRRELGNCPLLDPDGACGLYPFRPFACRALFSTRPADWCGVDFGELPTLEKQLFMASLDREVVDFPTHYLSEPRQIGEKLESEALLAMDQVFGFSISGNLPYLIWLEKEYRLNERIAEGKESTVKFLENGGLDLPFVIMLRT